MGCFPLKHKETSSFWTHFCISVISSISDCREKISYFQPFHVFSFSWKRCVYMYKVYIEKANIFLAMCKATEMHPVIYKFCFPRFMLTFAVTLGVSIWVIGGNAKGHFYPFCNLVIFYLLQGSWQQSVSKVLLLKAVEIYYDLLHLHAAFWRSTMSNWETLPAETAVSLKAIIAFLSDPWKTISPLT